MVHTSTKPVTRSFVAKQCRQRQPFGKLSNANKSRSIVLRQVQRFQKLCIICLLSAFRLSDAFKWTRVGTSFSCKSRKASRRDQNVLQTSTPGLGIGFAKSFVVIGLSLASIFSARSNFTETEGLKTKAVSSNTDLENDHSVVIAAIAPLAQKGILAGGPKLTPATWGDILEHMKWRMELENPNYHLEIYDQSNVDASIRADAIIAFDIQNSAEEIAFLTRNTSSFIALGCCEALSSETRIKGWSTSKSLRYPEFIESFIAILSKDRHEKLVASDIMDDLYQRRSSDDLYYLFLVLINVANGPVPVIQNSTKRSDAGLKELRCMISNCGREISQCFMDSTCRTALNCLNTCKFNDQVCSYRCIASFESEALAEFSLCILQKHNCLGLDASIPQLPKPKPLRYFRDQPLSTDLARDLLVGWLSNAGSSLIESEEEQFSWRVFAGKNAAYDYFPCQYQLFYPGKARNSFWYQPIFKVKTLDGLEKWRERLYRVRELDVPGTYRFSVLDNGVTSLEDWTLLDCQETLAWCVFHYRGAAAKAGLSYSGAILASRDGMWPKDGESLERIQTALRTAGIELWELSTVDNSNCGDQNLSRHTI